MIGAIVYMSNTGHTKQYAEILSEELGLPLFNLDEAINKLEVKTEIIYLGWIMADHIQGYKKVYDTYDVKAVIGVGLATDNADKISEANEIDSRVKLFLAQGGLDFSKLKGFQKIIMKMITKSMVKNIKKKKELSFEDKTLLSIIEDGKNAVSIDNLSEPIKWYRSMLENEEEK